MAILKFSASAVAAQIAHARACKTFLPNWNGPVDRPALILIVGNGVHLRSNGIDGTTTRIVTTEQADPSFAFADGMNPFRDTDWMAPRRMAFRDLTGQCYTDTRYDDGCWGYKDMEESAGPNESLAPLGLIALLSNLKDPDSYAQDWRQRCRDWAAIPDYEEGDKIRLATPVTLTDGSTCQIVTATHYRRGRQKRRCYRIEETGGLIRLSKASLAGSELLSSAKGAASPVLAEYLAGRD